MNGLGGGCRELVWGGKERLVNALRGGGEGCFVNRAVCSIQRKCKTGEKRREVYEGELFYREVSFLISRGLLMLRLAQPQLRVAVDRSPSIRQTLFIA